MDLRDLARANQKQILRFILRAGQTSRSDIARETGLAKSSITDITEKLIRAGILTELEAKRSTGRGRPVVMLALVPENSLLIVAEFADELARVQLVEPTGRVQKTHNRRLPKRASFEEYLAALKGGVSALARRRRDKVKGITIVGPGVVDPKKGMLLLDSHNAWRDKQLLAPFRRFGMPLFLQNGSRLRALAENWYGAARDVEDFLYFHLDTGIGGAIVTRGMIAEGPSHGAGEFGHTLSGEDGPPCPCGAKGCVESIASMRAIVKRIGRKDCRTFAAAWRLFQRGHPVARQAFEKAARTLGRCILNAAIAIGPTTVMIGGRMVDQTEGAILALIREEIESAGAFVDKLDIRSCALSDDRSSVLGAVAYALQEMNVEG